jgi:hypothetical protein
MLSLGRYKKQPLHCITEPDIKKPETKQPKKKTESFLKATNSYVILSAISAFFAQ